MAEAQHDMTIADIQDNSLRLGLTCNYCHRFRYLKDNRFARDMKLSALAETLHCAQCGSPDVRLEPIARDKATGFWPAEHN